MNQQHGFRRIIGGLPQCSGHCQQGRSICDCDPALPIGQDEPEDMRRSLQAIAAWLLAVVIVALCAVLVVWGIATAEAGPVVPVRAVKVMV